MGKRIKKDSPEYLALHYRACMLIEGLGILGLVPLLYFTPILQIQQFEALVLIVFCGFFTLHTYKWIKERKSAQQ